MSSLLRYPVHHESNKLGLKEHLAYNEQSKISVLCKPSLTLLPYLALNELTSHPSSGSMNYMYKY